MLYARILVPFDVSVHAEKALAHAVDLAKVHKSQIVLLHVIQEIPVFPDIGYASSLLPEAGLSLPFAEHLRMVYEESQKYLTQMLRLKAMPYGQLDVNIEAVVLVGNPVRKVIEYADNNKIDLIVVGSVGLGSRFAKLKALGSVSRGIAEGTSCPVLVIH